MSLATPNIRNRQWSYILPSDISTTSTSLVSLMSLQIFTRNRCRYNVHFNTAASSSSSSGRTILFGFVLDDTILLSQGGSQMRTTSTFGHSVTLQYTVKNITEALHKFEIRWAVSASTGRIRPASTADEHAVLIITEIAP